MVGHALYNTFLAHGDDIPLSMFFSAAAFGPQPFHPGSCDLFNKVNRPLPQQQGMSRGIEVSLKAVLVCVYFLVELLQRQTSRTPMGRRVLV